MNYIPADKLIAEIERLEVLYDEALKNPSFASYESSLIAKGKHRQREDLLSLIDSLQQEQPEADFDEEFNKFHIGMYNPFDSRAEIYEFAHHFYELGLNARKEE